LINNWYSLDLRMNEQFDLFLISRYDRSNWITAWFENECNNLFYRYLFGVTEPFDCLRETIHISVTRIHDKTVVCQFRLDTLSINIDTIFTI